MKNSPRGSDVAASTEEGTVLIVDDDVDMCEGLSALFRSVGLQVEVFASARDMLAFPLPDTACCLVVDVRLPRLSGLDLQAQLRRSGVRVPIIFISGHGDVAMTVKAMKAGASDFLTKPFRDQEILDAVTMALERDRKRRTDEKGNLDMQARFESLSPRERQVMAHVTNGLMNKQVAAKMGISEKTVKIHRGQVMRKMHAKSLVDLVLIAETLGIRTKSRSE
jgi:FixJ family two-component response regulator